MPSPSPKREDGELPASPRGAGGSTKAASPSASSPPPSKPDAVEPADTRKRKDADADGDGDAEMKDGAKEGAVEEKPRAEPKRRRIDDGKRSARMFGNILGTLRKFQDDEGKTKKSEAVSAAARASARPTAAMGLW